ncbi:hypothetical protein, partial [Vibrio sp. 1180_3]|uniref:hypothetical protein n=1 Tax=Vibrio sp. 1180_3 TaxID=2528832 RepID=UPI002405F181
SHNKQFKWILNAWQFYYALSKVFYGAMQRLGQCVAHHLIGRSLGLRKTVNLGWKGFGFSSYTPAKSQFLNYLASCTLREEFELNEVC